MDGPCHKFSIQISQLFRVKLGLLFPLLFMGCAAVDPFPDDSFNPEATLNEIENHSLTSLALKSYIEGHLGPEKCWPLPSWDLTHLELAARYYSPALAVSRAQLQLAEAGITTASMLPNPILNFWPAYDTGAVLPGDTPATIAAEFIFSITKLFHRKYLIAEAKMNSYAANFHLLQTTWDLRYQLKKALADLFYAKKMLKLTEEYLVYSNELVDLEKKLLSKGEVSRIALRAEEIVQHQVELQLESAKQQIKLAKIAIASAIGIAVEQMQDIIIDFPFEEELLVNFVPELRTLRYLALTSVPNVMESLYMYASAQVALQLEVARRFPDLQIGPGYTFDQSVNEWGIIFNTPIPMFNQNQGPIAEARARKEVAGKEFLAVQAQVLSGIDTATENYQAALNKQRDFHKIVNDEMDNYESLEAFFNVGESSYVDFLNAKVALTLSEIQYLQTLGSLQQAFDALEYAIHHPLYPQSEVLCGY